MINNPKISVITVVYNGERFLEQTIKSVINQTYKNIKYIVIDGGSTDGTIEIIKKYEDKINYWISEKDNGIYDAMNKGIDIASDDSYLLFLNAGDIFTGNQVLKKVINQISKYKDIGIVYGNADIYDEQNKFLTSLKALKLNKNNLNRFATRVVCHQSIFVKKSKIKKYSLDYRLKAELNWYYDILKNKTDNKILQLDFSISNYLLGGEGDKHFVENNMERIRVAYKQNNLLVFICNIPFFLIPFIFRFRRIIFRR